MRKARGAKERGFSLVELMMVTAMLGLVMAAIYSTFLTHQKTAFSQGEVVEVQHNLRVALDYLSRDLKMAGVLIPTGTTSPIAAAAGSPAFPTYSSSIALNTASAEGRLARIEGAPVINTPATSMTLSVEAPAKADTPNIVDGFAIGDNLRLIRPVDGSQPLTGTKSLLVTNASGNPSRGVFGTTAPSITVSKSDGTSFTAGDAISSDMLAKVADAGTYPMTVRYYLVNSEDPPVSGFACPANQKCLVRQVNGEGGPAEIIATNIASLRFSYLNDSYGEAVVPTDLAAIRAVRITVQGTTARTTVLSGGAKLRTATTLVKLRNRR